MTSGQTVHMSDLPAELLNDGQIDNTDNNGDWKQSLANKIRQQLLAGEIELASSTISQVEEILIKAALQKTNGRKNDAAILLGWGRNTLTRKIKELDI